MNSVLLFLVISKLIYRAEQNFISNGNHKIPPFTGRGVAPRQSPVHMTALPYVIKFNQSISPNIFIFSMQMEQVNSVIYSNTSNLTYIHYFQLEDKKNYNNKLQTLVFIKSKTIVINVILKYETEHLSKKLESSILFIFFGYH